MANLTSTSCVIRHRSAASAQTFADERGGHAHSMELQCKEKSTAEEVLRACSPPPLLGFCLALATASNSCTSKGISLASPYRSTNSSFAIQKFWQPPTCSWTATCTKEQMHHEQG